MSRKYLKPQIKEQKIKLNFFMQNPKSFDSFNAILIPPVFKQTACSGCSGTCAGSGCGGWSSSS